MQKKYQEPPHFIGLQCSVWHTAIEIRYFFAMPLNFTEPMLSAAFSYNCSDSTPIGHQEVWPPPTPMFIECFFSASYGYETTSFCSEEAKSMTNGRTEVTNTS